MQNIKKIMNHKQSILVVLSAAVGFIAIATGTILILKDLKLNSATVKTTAAASKSVGYIITAYQKPGAIPSLDQTLYFSSENTLNMKSVNYQASGRDYAVSVPAKDSLLFSAKDPKKPDDTALVQTETAAFMKKLGFAEIASIANASLPNQKYTTFKQLDVVCQLIDNVSTSAATHELSCIDASAVTNEYGRIEQLLNIYRKAGNKISNFTRATSFTNSQSDISYTLLTLTDGNRVIGSLLFATANKVQEYIGDVSSGDSKYSNGKYTITPETLAAMSNSKYNGFLLKNFTGQSSPPTTTK